MKILIQRACFAYGAIAFLGYVGWFIAICFSDAAISIGTQPTIALFAVHGLVLCITFQRFLTVKPFWAPLWNATPRTLTYARYAVWVSFGLCIGMMVLAMLTLPLSSDRSSSRMVCLVLASMGVVSSLYIALHWAFRPENLFTKGLLGFLSNPIAYITKP
jgi:hypothetical protein